MNIVVKRHGKQESFDQKKIYGSVYAACSNTGMKEKACEINANAVAKNVAAWAKSKRKVGSREIAAKVAAELSKRSKDAAFMYETHLDVA